MAIEVLLPKLGLTMQEGTVQEWIAKPGTPVRTGDVLLRLGTDKVDADVEAEGDGVFHPAVEAGAVLAPGTLIGWLLAEGEDVPTPQVPVDAAPAEELAGSQAEEIVAAAGATNGHGDGARLFASPNARRVATLRGVDLTRLLGSGPGGRIVSEDVKEFAAATRVDPRKAGPLVRRYAQQNGVDLAEINGTGPGGRVRRADVEAVVGNPQPVASPATTDVIPLKGMRGAIAERMHASLQEMAQLTHGYEVGMDAVVRLREQLKTEWAGTELMVPSLNDFVVRAAALALREHPLLNATVRGEEIHLLSDIHVGLAVAVPQGLLVPVIRDAADDSLSGLSRRTRELAVAAREGTLRLDQLEGATFVVTSLGSYGVDMFTPVIYPGNVAILGVGRLRDGVAWEGETPRRTQVLTLSLTFDHRAVDGAPAAEYLRTVDGLLQRPLRLLAA